MGQPGKRLLMLGLAGLWLAMDCMAFAPVAKAQFFNWFNSEPAPRPRARAKPPGDDLPPIVPKESTAPPPPDDRPYDSKLMRLAEILGAVHYLRELCGAQEGQLWRDEMKEILKNEGTTAVRRAKLVNSFNDGYRGYRRTYRTCTQSATLATTRFSTEGATIAASLAHGSTYASKGPPDAKPEASPEANKDGTSSDANKGAAPDANTGAVPHSDANKKEGAAAGTEPNGTAQGKPAQGAEAQAADAGHGKHRRHHKTPEAPATPETQEAPQPPEAPAAPNQGF
jgi:uncharacterized protein (TIGR02301 family)